MKPLLAIAILVLAGCGTTGPSTPGPSTTAPTASSSAPSASPGDERLTGWTTDLDDLVPAMDQIHPDLGHSTPVADLQAAAEALKATIPTAGDDELMVGVLRIVAMVSAKGQDGHTGAFIWGTGSYPVHSLPLRLWLFPDGVYIVAALPPFEGLVGRRIDTVNGHAIADVLSALDPLIPRDNATTVTLLTPRYLLIPEVLHGLGLADDSGSVDLGLVAGSGPVEVTAVEPVAMADYNAWAGPYGLHLPDDPDVLYLSDAENVLWATKLAGTGTLFIQYNRVEPAATQVLTDIKTAAADPAIRRVVVDIRHNYGGETSARSQVVDLLRSAPISGLPLFVITGRNTFSAASLFSADLVAQAHPTFVGEPGGGSPNLYGNPRDVDLRYSGLDITVAGEYFEGLPGDDRLSIAPDIAAPLTSADYFAGRDAALEAILAQP